MANNFRNILLCFIILQKMSEAAYYNSCANYYQGDYKKLSQLIRRHTSWQEAYQANASIFGDPEKLLEELRSQEISLCLFDDADFPVLLREIPFPPQALYYRGSLNFQEKVCVAMVGTRRASAPSLEIATQIAAELAKNDICIVSGLAYGIDKASHQGALQRNALTVAVLANGLAAVYPRRHARLAQEILEFGGALISEYPPNFSARQYSFLERNRVVSGLARAVVVIEAPKHSGTLSTARYATEQNRDLFVVPGSATNPNFAGSFELIRSGAELVTSSTHILQGLGIEIEPTQKDDMLTKEQILILAALNNRGLALHPDELLLATGLDNSTLFTELSVLVVAGYIKEDAGYYFPI